MLIKINGVELPEERVVIIPLAEAPVPMSFMSILGYPKFRCDSCNLMAIYVTECPFCTPTKLKSWRLLR